MEVVEGTAEVDGVDAFVARLGEVGDAHGCAVSAFDARYVVDRRHLARAVELADRARDRGETIADDHGIEILLYAAGRRQIDRALEMGVSPGEGPVVIVVHDPDGSGDEAAAVSAVRELLDPAETLDTYDRDRVRAFFDIDDAELAATDAGLPALVHERVALLPVEK